MATLENCERTLIMVSAGSVCQPVKILHKAPRGMRRSDGLGRPWYAVYDREANNDWCFEDTYFIRRFAGLDISSTLTPTARRPLVIISGRFSDAYDQPEMAICL